MRDDQSTTEPDTAMKACQPQQEAAEETIARLEQRVENLKTYGNGLKDTAAVLATELEEMRVLHFRADKSLGEHAEALHAARDLLCVFPAEPEEFFRVLIQRKLAIERTVKLALEFIRLTVLQPDQLRACRWLNDVHSAGDHMDVLTILIQSIGAQLHGGREIAHIPLGAEQMATWVKENANAGKVNKVPEPTGPTYYCPHCKRHVAPEDVDGNMCHNNPKAGRGCGNYVTSVEFVNPSRPPSGWEELATSIVQAKGRAVRVPVEPVRPHGDIDPETENALTTEKLGVEGWHCPACHCDVSPAEVYQIAPHTTPVHMAGEWKCGATLERKESGK